VERQAESSFARIQCEPLARVQGTLHVLVLTSTSATLPPPPTAETAAPARPNRPARADRPGVRSTAP
jgi:rod shape-determining protein MreC